jgi:hypothetical protein
MTLVAGCGSTLAALSAATQAGNANVQPVIRDPDNPYWRMADVVRSAYAEAIRGPK